MSTFCGVIWIMYTLRSFKAPMVHLSPGWTEATEKKDQGKLKSLRVKERDRIREKLKAATLIWMSQCVLLPMQNRTHQRRHRNSPTPPTPTPPPLRYSSASTCSPLGTERAVTWRRKMFSWKLCSIWRSLNTNIDCISSLCSSKAVDRDAVHHCEGRVFKNYIYQHLVEELSSLTSFQKAFYHFYCVSHD